MLHFSFKDTTYMKTLLKTEYIQRGWVAVKKNIFVGKAQCTVYKMTDITSNPNQVAKVN